MLVVRWQLSRLLGTDNRLPHNIEPALFFVSMGTMAVQKALEFSIPRRLSLQWARLEGKFRATINAHSFLRFLLQKFHNPALAQAPRNTANFRKHVVNVLNAVIVLCPGLAVVIVGEAILLRRDALLKSEDYSGVGQWSVLVCVGFLVGIQVLDWKVLQRQRAKSRCARAAGGNTSAVATVFL